MRTKCRLLSDDQIELLKTLAKNDLNESFEDVEDSPEYQNRLVEVIEALDIDAPRMDALRLEIHELKNRIQSLELELSLVIKPPKQRS